MKKSKKISDKLQRVYDLLFAEYGELTCPLEHVDPFQLVCAVMLSAQCTDVRVNQVTPELFAKYGTPEKLASAPPEEVENIIRPVGLFAAKSRNLIGAARTVRDVFGGEVPRTMEELLQLPGIGRKSANVVLGNAFGIPGFPADTHVQRLMTRLGFSDRRDPELCEKLVAANLPPEYWTNFSHLLIAHGRKVCKAARPACGNCVLARDCESCGKGR